MTIRASPVAGSLILGLAISVSAAEFERPNVLWFVVDDMSANFSCYGEKTVQTRTGPRIVATQW